MNDTIHIAYCLDDGYTEPTCVSMASVLANTKSNVHFHLIHNGLSDENKAKLSSLSEHFPYGKWNFHRIDFDTSCFILEPTIHFTIDTYYRFFIPKILPELEKIIYIDGDTVIAGDILELWNENLDGKIAGVVKDVQLGNFKERLELFGFNDWHYFNAGVLLLKLKEFEKLYSLEELPKIIDNLFTKFRYNKVYWYADQEVLNYLLNGEEYTKYLNVKYNLLEHDFDNYSNYTSFGQGCNSLREWNNANEYPTIIHYVGSKKPWHLNNDIMRALHWRLYYKYKALTPFYDPFDEKRIAEYERRERITRTEALLPANTYIQLFWRDIFADSAERVKGVIGNRKLTFWGASNHIIHIMAIFASRGLFPNVVVDGLISNYGKTVFEYTVQPAEMLHGKTEEYFVVLCMETKQARDTVKKILKEYGYDENGFTHAYAEAYDRENKPLL
jgi:lipopolysaccharide biosynthesis glycosyltransferase